MVISIPSHFWLCYRTHVSSHARREAWSLISRGRLRDRAEDRVARCPERGEPTMTDPRMTKLAEVLIKYSTRMKPGEKVLIEAIDVPAEMTCELIRVARDVGAEPLVTLKSNRVQRALLMNAVEAQMNLWADTEALRMGNVAGYIGLRGSGNIAELSDVPPEGHKIYQDTVWKRVHLDIRVPKTRWVVLRWPSSSMAPTTRT